MHVLFLHYNIQQWKLKMTSNQYIQSNYSPESSGDTSNPYVFIFSIFPVAVHSDLSITSDTDIFKTVTDENGNTQRQVMPVKYLIFSERRVEACLEILINHPIARPQINQICNRYSKYIFVCLFYPSRSKLLYIYKQFWEPILNKTLNRKLLIRFKTTFSNEFLFWLIDHSQL